MITKTYGFLDLILPQKFGMKKNTLKMKYKNIEKKI